MADVTLSAAVRGSLLSLQSTTSLIERTQGRLSSGLEVASAIDDPVKFFQAKTLTNRASDFDAKKDDIDQGISSITTASDAVEGVENIVSQLKGLALSAKSATSSQIGDLVSQFNDLRTQINNLTSDANYQGLNLVNGTGATLTVQFSNETSSSLTVNSVDVTANGAGLAVRSVVTAAELSGTALNVSYDFGTDVTLTSGGTLTVTYAGESDFTFGTGLIGNTTFTYGTHTVTMSVVGSAGATSGTFNTTTVITAGSTIAFTINTGNAAATGTLSVAIAGVGESAEVSAGNITGKRVVDSDMTTEITSLVNELDTGLTTLRSKAQTLGSNVALLQTRLEFTESYVNTLQSGGDKLTLANLNEEGANLLALQTRQQLGIQALSFAGQAEQGILGLFR